MRHIYTLFTLLFLLATSTFVNAHTVRGRVLSTFDGEPVIGISVVYEGTSIGTSTDEDGNFEITVPSSSGTLVFSGIGYNTHKEQINGRSQMVVYMTENCVVIGSEGDIPDNDFNNEE